MSQLVWELVLTLNLLLLLYAVCICSAGSYNQTNICFSWSFNRGFFLMNNIMILMLMRVHGNFVQQVVTKFNELYQQTKICPGYLSSLPFELQSQINNLHLLCYLKSYWCMYAYLYLSKHNKDLKKQNSIPLMHLVLFNNPL